MVCVWDCVPLFAIPFDITEFAQPDPTLQAQNMKYIEHNGLSHLLLRTWSLHTRRHQGPDSNLGDRTLSNLVLSLTELSLQVSCILSVSAPRVLYDFMEVS